MGAKMGNGKRTITLSVDSAAYDDFRKMCEIKGWIVSKQFENFMIEQVKREGKNNGRK